MCPVAKEHHRGRGQRSRSVAGGQFGARASLPNHLPYYRAVFVLTARDLRVQRL